MKKLAYVVAGLALFFVAGSAILLVYIVGKQEFEKNKQKTAPARANRWPKPDSETESNHVEPKTEIENETKV